MDTLTCCPLIRARLLHSFKTRLEQTHPTRRLPSIGRTSSGAGEWLYGRALSLPVACLSKSSQSALDMALIVSPKTDKQ